jgi:hypothetical protein
VPAEHVLLAGRLGPREVVRGREHVVAVAPVVDVGHRAVDLDVPAQDLDVLDPRAGLEHREQPRLDDAQLQQPRLAVVPVQLGEVVAEPRVLEEGGFHRAEVPAVRREDVTDRRVGLEAHEDVVAEQHHVTERHDVPWHAVVLGADAFGGDQFEGGAAERLDALVVQRLGAAGERGGLVGQPRPQHLVRAGVESRHAFWPLFLAI